MKKVPVVLTQNIKGVGFIGDQIEVKPGYARNYLIPRGLAVEQELASKFKKLAEKLRKEREEAISTARQLEKVLSGLVLSFERKIQEKGQIFGSVSAQDILKALAEKGLQMSADSIKLTSPIRTVGKHTVPIKLHTEVLTSVTVQVVEEGRKALPKKTTQQSEEKAASKTRKTVQQGKKKVEKAAEKPDKKSPKSTPKQSKAKRESEK